MSWTDTISPSVANGDYAAGLAALAHGAVVVPLSQFGLIRFEGDDTLAFLQGQLSSDVKKLNANQCQYASYSTPKGRMLASFLVMRHEDQCDLMLHHQLLPAIIKRLSMYVMRSKTKASDLSASHVLIGLAGPNASTIAQAVWGIAPPSNMQGTAVEGGVVYRLSEQRLLAKLSIDAALASWPALLANGAVVASDALWTLTDIRHGVVWVQPETVDAFVPQMANMELIGAVSFKKGCYPGQEIVARTQYLGKLKRRAFRVTSHQAMQAGESVFSPEMNGQASGTIALSAPAEAGSWEALVVIQTSSVEHGLHLTNSDGPCLNVLSLPYALEPESAT